VSRKCRLWHCTQAEGGRKRREVSGREWRRLHGARCAQSNYCSWRIGLKRELFFLNWSTHTLLHANRVRFARLLQCGFCNFGLPSWILGFPRRDHRVVPWDCSYERLTAFWLVNFELPINLYVDGEFYCWQLFTFNVSVTSQSRYE
jgi:hypothetical protein